MDNDIKIREGFRYLCKNMITNALLIIKNYNL